MSDTTEYSDFTMVSEVGFLSALHTCTEPYIPPFPEVPGVAAMPTAKIEHLGLQATNIMLRPVLREMRMALECSSRWKVRSLFRTIVIHLYFLSHKLWAVKFGLKYCSGYYEQEMICLEEIVSTVMRFSQGLLDEARNLDRHLIDPMVDPLGREIKPEASYALLHRVKKAFDVQHRTGHYDGAIPMPVSEDGVPEKRYLHATKVQLLELIEQLEIMNDLLIKACHYLWGEFSVQVD